MYLLIPRRWEEEERRREALKEEMRKLIPEETLKTMQRLGMVRFRKNGSIEATEIEVTQKTIDESELEDYLSVGWKYVATINSGKIVVERA